MKIVRKSEQSEINSETCGQLREVINDSNISMAVFHNIEPTKMHYHKKMVEYYYMLEGWVEMEILTNEDEKIFRIEKGDIVKIEKGERHEITKSSKENEMLCINSPGFVEGDEYN